MREFEILFGGFMNFDNNEVYEKIDRSNFLQEIRNLDKKISYGWEFTRSQMVSTLTTYNHIVFFGFQEYKTEISLLSELCKPHLIVPINIIHENDLPDWIKNKDQLVICFVQQNNAEKIQNLFSTNMNNCSVFFLEKNAGFNFSKVNNLIGHWKLNDLAFNRTSIGYDLMVLYGLLNKLNFVPGLANEVNGIPEMVHNSLIHLDISVPSSLNPAKRLAGQMVGRWIKIIGGGISKPIAQLWCEQINKTAKNLAFSEDVYQLFYHSLSGIYFPENLIHQSMAIFLKSTINEDIIEGMIDSLKEELMCNGLGTDFYSIRGNTRLSQIVNSILFGDFVAYYLAIANKCDPYPIATLDQ